MNCGGCNQPLPPGYTACEVCGWVEKAQVRPTLALCACGCGKPGSISTSTTGTEAKWYTGACWRRLNTTHLPDDETRQRNLTKLRDIIEKAGVR